MSAVISIEGLSFYQGHQQILKDINLQIQEEEFIGLIGPNGSGKTTLIKLILGLLKPAQGIISIKGRKPEQARSLIGYVSQHHQFNRMFPITVRDAVLMGRLGSSNIYPGSFSSDDQSATDEMITLLELEDIQYQSLSSLSGGQMQKVWMARALVIKPEILLLDEPTANVDLKAEENIYSLLKRFNEHMTIVVVSHDIAFISSYIKRVACLNQSLVCHDVASINDKTLEELYGGKVKMIHHHH